MNCKRFFGTIIKNVKDKSEIPKLCRDCKYMKPNWFYIFSDNKYEFGKCAKIFDVDVITGKITYNYASFVREYDCKGSWYLYSSDHKNK